jgi:hypothetical protein
VAFFFKRVQGTAAFWGMIAAQLAVLVIYFQGRIAYLWLNPIGCAACVLFSLILQAVLGDGKKPAATAPSPR